MLLKSRFYLPPARPQDVIRAPLIERLERCRGGEIVVIAAPAGYGKTTLVSQWLHQRPVTHCWLSLDEGQADPLVFWRYLAQALNSIQPEVGRHALALAEDALTEPVPTEVLLNELIVSLLNDLDDLSIRNRSNEPATLVLDDFHKAVSPGITLLHSSFNLFLDHLPPALRVVLTTRESPPINLSRRRMSRQLTELGAADLVFSPAECRDFFNRSKAVSLDQDQISTLLTSSEGWAAGLQLIALSLERDPHLTRQVSRMPHLNTAIADYLLEQVFELQPEAVRRFLVLTACTSKFCAALANRIAGIDNSYELIRHLERMNLFVVPLDNHGTWYRYHDLFRRYLLNHFGQLSRAERQQAVADATDWIRDGGYGDLMVADPDTQAPAEPAPNGNAIDFNQAWSPAEPLTKREAQVMALMADGLSNKVIADQLNISLNTLKVHIRNLYGKIGVENRSQALAKLAKSTAG